jgi:hypothetical protein
LVSGPGETRTHSIPRSEQGWSAGIAYRASVVRRFVKDRPERPAGVKPACPVWKTDAWAARPRARRAAEREASNPQGSSLGRLATGCHRLLACPSVLQSGCPASDAGGLNQALLHPDQSVGPEGLEPSPRWLRARHATANTWIPCLVGPVLANKKGQGSRDAWPAKGLPPEGPGVRAAADRRAATRPGNRPVPPRASNYPDDGNQRSSSLPLRLVSPKDRRTGRRILRGTCGRRNSDQEVQ